MDIMTQFAQHCFLKQIVINTKNKQVVYSGCLLRLGVLCALCCSVCLFLYGPFCHGALKHVYIVYNILNLNISFFYISNITTNLILDRVIRTKLKVVFERPPVIRMMVV